MANFSKLVLFFRKESFLLIIAMAFGFIPNNIQANPLQRAGMYASSAEVMKNQSQRTQDKINRISEQLEELGLLQHAAIDEKVALIDQNLVIERLLLEPQDSDRTEPNWIPGTKEILMQSNEQRSQPSLDTIEGVSKFIQCAAPFVMSHNIDSDFGSIKDTPRISPHTGVASSADKYLISGDGNYMLTSKSKIITLYTLDNGKTIRAFSVPESVGEFELGMSPDNKYIYYISQNNPVSTADAVSQSLDLLRKILSPFQLGSSEAPSEDDVLRLLGISKGNSAGSGKNDEMLHHVNMSIFDSSTGEEIQQCQLIQRVPSQQSVLSKIGPKYSVITRFSQDGSLLLHTYFAEVDGNLVEGADIPIQSVEKNIGLWDVAGNDWKHDLQPPQHALTSYGNKVDPSQIAFSRDNRFVVLKLHYNVIGNYMDSFIGSAPPEARDQAMERVGKMMGLTEKDLKQLFSMAMPIPAESLVLYDTSREEPIEVLYETKGTESSNAGLTDITLSDDGTFIMVNESDKNTILFNRPKGEKGSAYRIKEILGVAFLSKEKLALFKENDVLKVRNIKNWDVQGRYWEQIRTPKFVLDRVGNRIFVSGGNETLSMNIQNWRPQRSEFDSLSHALPQMIAPDGKSMLIFQLMNIKNSNYILKKIDLKSGKTIWALKDHSAVPTWKISISPNGNYMVVPHFHWGTTKTDYILHDFKTGESIRTFRQEPSLFSMDHFFTKDNKILCLEYRPFNNDFKKTKSLIAESTKEMPNEQKSEFAKFLQQKFEQEAFENKMAGYKNSLLLIDPNTRNEKILQQSNFHYEYATLSPDGNSLAFVTDNLTENDRIVRVLESPFDGEPKEIVNLGAKENDGFEGLNWGPKSDLLLIKRKHSISVFDVKKAMFIKQFQAGKDVKDAVISIDGKYLFSLGEVIRIHSLTTGQVLADLIVFRDGEWIFITPAGYFDLSSVEAAKRMDVSFGIKAYDINQFYDIFFRPDIVRASLREQSYETADQLTIKEAVQYPPPKVEIVSCSEEDEFGKIKLKYRIRSIGESGIGEVRIFNNGKLIFSDGQYTDISQISKDFEDKKIERKSSANRGAQTIAKYDEKQSTVEPWLIYTPEKARTFEEEITIQTIPGANEIAITAFNGQNSVQSVLETMHFQSRQPMQPRALYILNIGIDKYKDSYSKLKFAVKDARDMGLELQRLQTDRYDKGDVHIRTILDEGATRTNILKVLQELATEIRPIDDFILFVAGHGVLLDGAKYAILTHDYDGLKGKTGSLLDLHEFIGSHEIMRALQQIQALGQLVILDTCHAGGINQLVADLYNSRMSVFAKRMGLHIYASASSKEGALDGYRENGLFTFSLLEGLRNNSEADGNHDREVSVEEWGHFAKQKTTNIAQQLHHRQNPLIINFGQDRIVYKLQ